MNAFSITEGSADAVAFSDVSADAWYYQYVLTASSAGLVYGDGENFRPESFVTREDLAVMIYRFAKQGGKNLEDATPEFLDNDSISDYAVDAIGSLHKNKFINGKGDNKFYPKATATRAEVAQIIYNIIK